MYENLVYPEYSGRILTMFAEDDREIQTAVLVVFKLEETDEQQYVALVELEDGNPTEELSLFYFKEEDGAPVINNIDDDDVFSKVAEFFGDYLDYMQKASHGDCSSGCCGAHDHGDDDCGCCGQH